MLDSCQINVITRMLRFYNIL